MSGDNAIDDLLNKSSSGEMDTVLDILFQAVQWYASRPDQGLKARSVLNTLNRDYGYSIDFPKCSHCERPVTILRRRHDDTYVCEDAYSCYRELRENVVDGVVVNTRMYQRNTIISYWDARELPCSIEEYIQKERPVIYARISNIEMTPERYEEELSKIEEGLA